MTWRSDIENVPTEAGDFFLVRPRGLHPTTGKPFLPTIVQQIDGDLYLPSNEIDKIIFGRDEPCDNWRDVDMEWQPLPADWT